MRLNKRVEIDEADRKRAECWIVNLNLSNLDDDLKIKLRSDFYFAKRKISREAFEREHGGVSIEDWQEADFLLRDIEVADAVLTGLLYSERRNALAALNGFKRKNELALYLKKSESHIGDLLNLRTKVNSFPESISELALFLDVMDEQIIHDDIRTYENNFNNYIKRSKRVKLSELAEYTSSKKDWDPFVIVNDVSFISAPQLYGRVKKGIDYQSVEIYNLNVNSLEIHDFSFYLGFMPCAVTITPALLRGRKKVVYYRETKEQAPFLSDHLTEMSMRRLTVVKRM